MKVFVSRPMPAFAMERLASRFEVAVGPADRSASAEELLAGARDADALVAMVADRVDGALLEACPRLRIVANFAVGVDNVDVAAARTRGVAVTNTPGVLTEATADMAFALLLAAARNIPSWDAALRREGRFAGWAPLYALGADVSGQTLGIVGLGRIGAAVARRARGFGMEVICTTATAVPPDVKRVPFGELLDRSDFVSIHCPLTPATRHLLGPAAFERMKPTAILINTARGPIVDEAALVAALSSGAIAGAGLDVYENEPSLHPGLAALPNVVLAPHAGSATVGARSGMARLVCEDVEAVLAGQPPLRPVT